MEGAGFVAAAQQPHRGRDVDCHRGVSGPDPYTPRRGAVGIPKNVWTECRRGTDVYSPSCAARLVPGSGVIGRAEGGFTA